MPRCICHLMIALDILDTKLVNLRKIEEDKDVKEEKKDTKEEDEGNLGGLLERRGLTHIEEGSSSPQEPAGDLEPNSKEDTGAVPVSQEHRKEEESSSPPLQPERDRISAENEEEKAGEPSEMMQKMRRMMKKADREEELRKAKKTADLRKKEECRKEEDRQEAKKSKNVRKMIMKWKEKGEESGTGSTPNKLDIVRKNPVRKTDDKKTAAGTGLTGTRSEEGSTEKIGQDPGRSLESSKNNIGNDILNTKVRKKETAVGVEKDRKQQVIEVEVEEEGSVRKEFRKHEDPRQTPTPTKGNIKDETNLVRKPLEEDRKESARKTARKTARNKEQEPVKQESCQGGPLRVGGSGKKERRSSIKDLIRNYNNLNKGEGGGGQELMIRNRNVRKVVVEEMRSQTGKRKASEVEDDSMRGVNLASKRNRPLPTDSSRPESTRDNTILKYFNCNNLFVKNDSTGDELGPVQAGGHGGDEENHSRGVGEVFCLRTSSDRPDAPAKPDVKQLPG